MIAFNLTCWCYISGIVIFQVGSANGPTSITFLYTYTFLNIETVLYWLIFTYMTNTKFQTRRINFNRHIEIFTSILKHSYCDMTWKLEYKLSISIWNTQQVKNYKSYMCESFPKTYPSSTISHFDNLSMKISRTVQNQ